MSGPALLLDLAAAGSVMSVVARALAGRRRRRTPRGLTALLALGAAAPVAYLLGLRPWHQRWGATDEELCRPLPGDDLVPDPGVQSTRAITIDAPVEAVWPWIAQIGQDRGGFYSYEWLENLAGCHMRNADRIHPEWQQRAIGETVLLHPRNGLEVAVCEPNRALVLRSSWGFFVEPIDADRTRLLIRSRAPGGWFGLAYALLVEIPHFVMERKMLLGVKERAEHAADVAAEPTAIRAASS